MHGVWPVQSPVRSTRAVETKSQCIRLIDRPGSSQYSLAQLCIAQPQAPLQQKEAEIDKQLLLWHESQVVTAYRLGRGVVRSLATAESLRSHHEQR
jgi:hypothetical protein